jgi:hypothetical protein
MMIRIIPNTPPIITRTAAVVATAIISETTAEKEY